MAAPVLFTNIRIFDGTGTAPYPGEVRVEGQRIVAVAPAPARLDRSGATVVDGGGAVLMPGMVEAHAHLFWPCAYDRIILDKAIPPEEHLLITARNARITLDHGFTGAYSAGSLGDELGLVKEGYLADLLLVDGDPTADIAIMQDKDRLKMIMKDGAYHKTPPMPRS